MEGHERPLRLDEPLETWPAVVLCIGLAGGLGEATARVLRGDPAHDPGPPRDHLECVALSPDDVAAAARLEQARGDLVRRGGLAGRADVRWGETVAGVRAPELVIIVSGHDLETHPGMRDQIAAKAHMFAHTTLLVHDWPPDRRVDVREGDLANQLIEMIPHAEGPLLVALVDAESGRAQSERALGALVLDLQRRPYLDEARGPRLEPRASGTEVWRVWIHGAELDRARIVRDEAAPMLVQVVQQFVLRELRGNDAPRYRTGGDLLDEISKNARPELKLHPAYADALDPDLGIDGPSVKLSEEQTHVHVSTPPGLGRRPKGVSAYRLEEHLTSLDSALMHGRVWYWVRALDEGVAAYVGKVEADLRSAIPTWAERRASLPYLRRCLQAVPGEYGMRLATEFSRGRLPSFRLAIDGLREAVGRLPDGASVVARSLFLVVPLALAVLGAVADQNIGFAVTGAVLGVGALAWIGAAEAVARRNVTRAYEHAKRCLRARIKRKALHEVGEVFARASDRIGALVDGWMRGFRRVEEDLVRGVAEISTETPTPPASTVGRVSAWRAEHPDGLFDTLWEQGLQRGERALKESDEVLALVGAALRDVADVALDRPEEADPVDTLRTALRSFVAGRVADVRLWRAYVKGKDVAEPSREVFVARYVQDVVRTIEEMRTHVDADVRQALMRHEERVRPFVAPDGLRRWHPDHDVDESHRSVGEWCYVRLAVRLAIRLPRPPEDDA